MPELKALKPVLFDTSTWDIVIRSGSSFNYDAFLAKGMVPFITIEIFLELINVSPMLRKKRVEYLLALPMLSTIRFNSQYLGSFVDVCCYEYQYLNSASKTQKLSDFILGKTSYFPGKQLWPIASLDMEKFIRDQTKVYISVSQSMWMQYEDPDVRLRKLKDIPFVATVLEEKLREHRVKVFDLLTANADKKKSNDAKKEAAEYFVEILYHKQAVIDKGNNPLLSMVREMGVEVSDLDGEQTLQELIENYEYVVRLKNYSRYIGISLEKLKSIDQKWVNTWNVEKLFQREYEEKLLSDRARPAETSSIVDKRQASLSCYLTVVVDKRSRDILEALRKKYKLNIEFVFLNSIDGLMNI